MNTNVTKFDAEMYEQIATKAIMYNYDSTQIKNELNKYDLNPEIIRENDTAYTAELRLRYEAAFIKHCLKNNLKMA